MKTKPKCILYAFLTLSVLGGCSPSAGPLDKAAIRDTIGSDLKTIYHQDSAVVRMSLEEALARGIRYNLDTQVAALETIIASNDISLEMLNTLPQIKGNIDSVGRNNQGGSSSQSVTTGLQSLESSVSTEQFRITQKLEASWNILDAGLAIARARGASDRQLISEERRRKVFQNIIQDVYSAYWRAAAAQKMQGEMDVLIGKTNEEIAKLDKAVAQDIVPYGDASRLKQGLLDKQQQLMGLKERMQLSELELKALTALPPDTQLELDLDRGWTDSKSLPSVKKNMLALETVALTNRPEVREELLNKRMTARNVRMTIFETFPGVQAVVNANKDQNKFLVDQEWLDYTFSLTGTLTKVLTLPARYQKAKNETVLADKRRHALLTAVITQVHVAMKRYEHTKKLYETVSATDRNQQQALKRARGFAGVGMMGAPEAVGVEIEAATARANRLLTYADAQQAYGQFLNTLGVDFWGDNTQDMTVPQLAHELKKNIARLEKATVDANYDHVGVGAPKEPPEGGSL